MIEVRIRALMKGDHGYVVPSVTLTDIKKPDSLDVAKIAADLIAELPPELGNLRPMTADEADAYCAMEEAEVSEGYIDLGSSDANDEESGW